MPLDITEDTVEMYLGATYKFKEVHNVGELKRCLQEIINDLPEDDNLKISELHLGDRNQLSYILEKGIAQ